MNFKNRTMSIIYKSEFVEAGDTMKNLKILAIIFAIIAAIGLISFIAGTRSVNIGAFIFPAIFAITFAILYVRKNSGKR